MITKTMTKVTNDIALDKENKLKQALIALDRENKLKQALAEGYDFVAIENSYDNENINICYHFFKGEVPKANRFKEIYNLVLFRENFPEHASNSNSISDKSESFNKNYMKFGSSNGKQI